MIHQIRTDDQVLAEARNVLIRISCPAIGDRAGPFRTRGIVGILPNELSRDPVVLRNAVVDFAPPLADVR